MNKTPPPPDNRVIPTPSASALAAAREIVATGMPVNCSARVERKLTAIIERQFQAILKDRARLDWLDENCKDLIWDDNGFWFIRHKGAFHNGNTPREAIDAARAALNPQGTA